MPPLQLPNDDLGGLEEMFNDDPAVWERSPARPLGMVRGDPALGMDRCVGFDSSAELSY